MKTGKFSRLISLLLAVMMVAGLITVMPTAAMAAEPGISSTGYDTNGKFLAPIGEPDPSAIPIYTAQDLDNVRNNLTGSYVLMNDIDLAGFNGGEWEPIGSGFSYPDYEFKGVFDGQGHVIKNLHITASVRSAGLFYLSAGGSVIKNVGMEDTYIYAVEETEEAGAISGTNHGIITNCYNTGAITNSWLDSTSAAGGICGYNYGYDLYGQVGIIEYCYNTGDITAYGGYQTFVGGIVGISYSGSIAYCFNTGSLYGEAAVHQNPEVGGIVGNAHCSISNCYNTGSVYATTSTGFFEATAGGICGFMMSGDIHDATSNCYNTGSVYVKSSSNDTWGDSVYAGGILGYNVEWSPVSIYNCISLSSSILAENIQFPDDIESFLIGAANGTKSGNLALYGIPGNAEDDADRRISLAEAKSKATYEALGWDFDNVWIMVPGYDFPQLRGMYYDTAPIEIYTAQDLDDVRNNLSGS